MTLVSDGPWDDWYLEAGDGVTLYVREVGSGPVLAAVLHGGWGGEHSYLLDAVRSMDSRARFVFYDQRGSLRSPCPPDLISVERHIADLEALRIQLGVEKLVLVGHSMGCFLAMAYAQAHPENVGGLVLLGCVTPVMPRPGSIETSGPTVQQLLDRPAIAAELNRLGLDTEGLPDKQATHRWRINFAGGNLYNIDRWPMLKGGRIFYNMDAGDAASASMPRSWNFVRVIEEIGCPVTVIQGDHDSAAPAAVLEQLFARVRNAEVIVLPEAGHISWIDQPSLFERALTLALDKCLF